jgi:hypothetical protein
MDEGDLNVLRINPNGRWSVDLEIERDTALLESERDIIQEIGAPFALAGNVGALTPGGEIDMDALRGMVGGRTRMVAVVHVSNTLGTINPVEEIVAMAHEAGALTMVDATQSVPHMPVDATAIGSAAAVAIHITVRQLEAACSSLPPQMPATPPTPIDMSEMPMNIANMVTGSPRRVTAAMAGPANDAAAPISTRPVTALVNPALQAMIAHETPVARATSGTRRAAPSRSSSAPAGSCISAYPTMNAGEISPDCSGVTPRSTAISGRMGA